MSYKILSLLLLTFLLSSCCWLSHDDCIESSGNNIPLAVTINHSDSVLNINDNLSIKIASSDFQTIYDESGFNQFSFNVQIDWFDGNFSSSSNHKVNLVNSNLNGLSLTDYSGYYGALPANDIEFDLEFTVPGYYLISFYGSANKYEEQTRRNRCGCGNGFYQNFSFDNPTNNNQYYPLYQSSAAYPIDQVQLEENGVYFIKVEN